jgi:REP element-mobilizing transposase RayT
MLITFFMRRTQSYLGETFKPRLEHGGSLNSGRRKLERPIDPKRPLHLVVGSSKAKGSLSFLHPSHCRKVDGKVRALARRFGICIYQFANSGNHLHLLIQGKTRKSIQDFIRALGCRIAQLVTGAGKGKPFGKFWDALAYTRVVEWGRAFREAKYYVLKNFLEAEGLLDHVRLGKYGRARP